MQGVQPLIVGQTQATYNMASSKYNTSAIRRLLFAAHQGIQGVQPLIVGQTQANHEM